MEKILSLNFKAEIINLDKERLFNIQSYEFQFYISGLNSVCIVNLN